MKYRKKPVVIDAVQWTGTNKREIFDFLTNGNCPVSIRHLISRLYLTTSTSTNGRFQAVWLLRHSRANICRILVIISSAMFTVNFIRASQIYSEKLMRRWKHE